ncbi:DUF2306 domain-containing protein [Amycolatopsis sp. NPDC051716]|jgi:hypothetical protein|uniref:DUF2306 domain-containing protein n=1 Tax=Amycolatopsis sp. NPDC051716 TaxID=3155804 RepID=UPI0034279D36
MSQNLDSRAPAVPGERAPGSPPRPARGAGRKPFWRRPWLLPLALLLGAFLLWRVPAVVTLNPRAFPPVTLNPTEPLHHSVMLLHVACGTIAWITVCLQLSPWLRRKYPAVHRTSGRIYVFGGMIPAALLAIMLIPLSSWGPIAKAGMACWAVLSLGTTITGLVMARQRRYGEHRRWMLYSFAMAMSVITGRLIAILVLQIPGAGPQIIAATHGELEGFWLGWLVNAALVFWWLRRTRKPRKTPAPQPANAG